MTPIDTAKLIPVFPRPDAHPTTQRTPLAEEFLKVSQESIARNIENGMLASRYLPPEIIARIATDHIEEYLDNYAKALEAGAMEVAADDRPGGLVAIWHGTSYEMGISDQVPPGYLLEERCNCGRRP